MESKPKKKEKTIDNRWQKEEKYRRFLSYMKVMEWRANDKAREEKDENAKKIGEEYKTIRFKLNKIYKIRHLALILEENEESILYKQILEIVENEYSGNPKKSNEESDKIYQLIKELVKDYPLVEEKSIQDNIEKGSER